VAEQLAHFFLRGGIHLTTPCSGNRLRGPPQPGMPLTHRLGLLPKMVRHDSATRRIRFGDLSMFFSVTARSRMRLISSISLTPSSSVSARNSRSSVWRSTRSSLGASAQAAAGWFQGGNVAMVAQFAGTTRPASGASLYLGSVTSKREYTRF